MIIRNKFMDSTEKLMDNQGWDVLIKGYFCFSWDVGVHG